MILSCKNLVNFFERPLKGQTMSTKIVDSSRNSGSALKASDMHKCEHLLVSMYLRGREVTSSKEE